MYVIIIHAFRESGVENVFGWRGGGGLNDHLRNTIKI